MTFLVRVGELAEKLGGNGEALIESLRKGSVSRFRSQNIEELAEGLEGEGYVDPEETLGREERKRQVLLDAAGPA